MRQGGHAATLVDEHQAARGRSIPRANARTLDAARVQGLHPWCCTAAAHLEVCQDQVQGCDQVF
jgi:hypothetical protein